MEQTERDKHIIPFKQWLRENIKHCSPEVREKLSNYYLEGSSETGSRFYQLKDMGVEALSAMYSKECEWTSKQA